jgi:predicted secreted protein
LPSKWTHGKGLVATLGGTVLNVKGWSVDAENEAVEVTNSGSGGNEEWLAGIAKREISIEANWDSQANYFNNPPNLSDGQIVTYNLQFASGSPAYSGSMIIKKTSVKAEVKSVTTFMISGSSTAANSLPIGTF